LLPLISRTTINKKCCVVVLSVKLKEEKRQGYCAATVIFLPSVKKRPNKLSYRKRTLSSRKQSFSSSLRIKLLKAEFRSY
jgi:hypothetical protein